jgi:hypothetical protein
LLISQADPAIKDGIVTLRPGKVSIWSPDGKLRLLDDATGRPKPVRQSANGQMHGGDATWFDTTSTDLFQQDWQIRYYDSRSRTTRLIADSNAVFPGVKELRPPPHDTIPVLSDDGTIYWAAAAPDKNAHLGFTGVILARDSKARGPVRTIARKATLPTIVGSTSYYARLDDVSPDTPAKKVEIHAVTPRGRDRVVVTAPLVKDQQILRLTASATHLVWVISDTDRQAEPSPDLHEGCADTKYQGCSLYVMKHGTNQATRIKLHSYSANPKLSPTLLGWRGSGSPGDTGEYVMDLASNKIWRVGAARGCSEVTLAGPYARWFTATPDGQCAGQLIVRWCTPQ